jgi:CRISPR/Cas system CSM-associated protein Csm3 (group 7 of RAMP superfamily)
MKTYTLQITLESNALIGSGEGYGAIIDADVAFDDIGIPYIPVKRIKGCLRDAAIDVCVMLYSAQIKSFLDLTTDISSNNSNKFKIITDIFGKQGQESPAPFYFTNLMIDDYDKNKEWLEYFLSEHANIISGDSIRSFFTELRQQTAIDDNGVAGEHSLRTIRTIKKGITFKGEICCQTENQNAERILALACRNLRYMGTKRNRGFGKIKCELLDIQVAPILNDLEALCKN